jgi:hypothetical protein
MTHTDDRPAIRRAVIGSARLEIIGKPSSRQADAPTEPFLRQREVAPAVTRQQMGEQEPLGTSTGGQQPRLCRKAS